MRKKLRFRRTTVFTLGLAAFLVGLALGKTAGLVHTSWILLSPALLLFACARRRGVVIVILVCTSGLILGMARGANFAQKIQPYENFYGQDVVLRGTSLEDAVYDDRGQLSFDIDNVNLLHPEDITLPGRVAIGGIGISAIYRGDKVEVKGKIYPAGGSRQGRVRFAQVEVLSNYESPVEDFRRNFVAGAQSALPEPHASLGLGLLVGQRNTLPEDVSEMMSIVGLTHIIAVSGYNLTIIVRGVRRILGKHGSRYQSLLFSLVLIGLFLLITGFSASIVRAAVVSILSLIAWYYGRTFKPLLLMGIAAALTAGINPVYIWSDIGWYLSFVAFFGVLVIAPLLTQKLYGTKKKPGFIMQAAIESICAQAMAVPVIMYIFGETSLVAIFSNVLVVPIIPYAMVATVIAGLAGYIFPAIAGFIALPARFILTYILDVITVFAQVPGALVKIAINNYGLIGLYASMIIITLALKQNVVKKYGKITETNVIE